jgi:hypothetical protein
MQKKALYARERPARGTPHCSPSSSLRPPLHDRATASALLGRIRVVLLVDGAPDRGDHEVLCAVRVDNDAVGHASVKRLRAFVEKALPGRGELRVVCVPVRSLRDRDTVALQILSQAVVQFGQAAQLEVGHRLLVLLDL